VGPARDVGAGPLRILFVIVIPLIKRSLLVAFALDIPAGTPQSEIRDGENAEAVAAAVPGVTEVVDETEIAG